MTALRAIAFVVGVALLAATAHATIAAGGGYEGAHAIVIMAVAAGVAISALVIGSAWADRRGLALWLIVAIIAGEAFGFLSTAERLIAGREAQQVPLRTQAVAYEKAARRVADAATALSGAPVSSPRLEAAIAEKTAADSAASDKSAERGCAVNCRQLLQARVDAAEREISAARAELTAQADAKGRELEAAHGALARLSPPASATPLADRIGVPAWLLDLIAAALGSMAANGLGCGLIAYAGHGRRPGASRRQMGEAPAEVVPPVELQANPMRSVQRFALDRLHPTDRDAGIPVAALRGEFHQWCGQRKIAPPPGPELGRAMRALFDRLGVALVERNGQLVAMGIALKADAEQLVLPAPGRLGRMHRRASVALAVEAAPERHWDRAKA
jgi:hypothetical protein